ncbi:MAG: DUF2156 domain-containing protein [Thermoplasmatota archaeon]
MISLEDFNPVSLDDLEPIRDHYRKYPPEHSDYLHGIMYTWKDYMTYKVLMEGDHLFILGEHDGRIYLRPPVGPKDRKVYSHLLELASVHGLDPKISMIGQQTKEWMEVEFPELTYEQHRDYFDYIYLSSDLADLPGKDYLKVRNYLNKFRKNNEYSVEPISDDNLHETRDFLIRWCEQKGCQDEPFLLHERQATMNAIDHFGELDLEGIVIRVDGRIEALSIFEEMRPDTAVIHYEKANFDIAGLYQAINNEAALVLRERYTYIDRESDMGEEGLRRAKMKYRPHHMLEIFHAK